MASSKQPTFTKRDGLLTVTVWENESERGNYHTANLERSYQDSNDEWKKTTQLSGADLLKGSLLLQEAYTDIKELRKATATAEA